MSERTAECERCGIEYKRYLIFYKDDFPTLVERVELREEYECLCRECFDEEMNTTGYVLMDMAT